MDGDSVKPKAKALRRSIDQLAEKPEVFQTCQGPLTVSTEKRNGRVRVKIEPPEAPGNERTSDCN